MKAVALTSPEIVAGEAEIITGLLRDGWWRVHLRHPHTDIEAVAAVIDDVPTELRSRISVHDGYDCLHSFFPEIGLHENSRQSGESAPVRSRSCHSMEEVERAAADYVMLSPVFDSISKPGYRAAFDTDTLLRLSRVATPIIALGGIDLKRLPLLARYNFSGFAMLGAIPWHDSRQIKEFSKNVIALC